MAAPVIWFGSWLLSLMTYSLACSGCALRRGLVSWMSGKIKRGPRGPMHTARMWMASATPGGAPGYDDDKQFGNFITHMAARTSQRLRGYSQQASEVKGRWQDAPKS